jgi:hypothetical protein
MISNRSNDTPIVHGNRATLRGMALLVLALLGALALASTAQAQTKVGLGTAGSFAVLAGSEVTNTGPTVVSGSLGVSPLLAISGFPPGIVINGSQYTGAGAAGAQAALTTAYDDAAGRFCDSDLSTQDLGGMSLTSGVYCFTSDAGLTGTVTLNGQGNANSVFIFQVGSSLTVANAARVRLINGAQACNVFWQIGITATLGTTARMRGTVMALTSITAATGATVQGRLLARNAETTLQTNTITRSPCDSAGPAVTIGGAPGDNVPGNPVRAGAPCIAVDFRLRIRAHDPSGIRRVDVLLDGNRIRRSDHGQFNVWIRAERLTSARHTLRVVATDNLGNQRVQTRNFRRCARATLPAFTGRPR